MVRKSSLGPDIRRTYRLPVRIRYIRGGAGKGFSFLFVIPALQKQGIYGGMPGIRMDIVLSVSAIFPKKPFCLKYFLIFASLLMTK